MNVLHLAGGLGLLVVLILVVLVRDRDHANEADHVDMNGRH